MAIKSQSKPQQLGLPLDDHSTTWLWPAITRVANVTIRIGLGLDVISGAPDGPGCDSPAMPHCLTHTPSLLHNPSISFQTALSLRPAWVRDDSDPELQAQNDIIISSRMHTTEGSESLHGLGVVLSFGEHGTLRHCAGSTLTL